MLLEVLEPDFTICKVEDLSTVDLSCEFTFAALTDGEASLVCPAGAVPEKTFAREDGWRAFRVAGALDFSLTGILAGIAHVLADARIGIFAVSTYDTDYVLTKTENFDRALSALADAGYEIAVSR